MFSNRPGVSVKAAWIKEAELCGTHYGAEAAGGGLCRWGAGSPCTHSKSTEKSTKHSTVYE